MVILEHSVATEKDSGEERFLLADLDSPNSPIQSAVAIFAVLGAFNLAKAKGIKFSHRELREILTECKCFV